MSQQTSSEAWKIQIGELSLTVNYWSDNGNWVRLDGQSSDIVDHRGALIAHIASKAGLFASLIRAVLNQLLPAEVPKGELRGQRLLGSCLLQVEASPEVTLVYVTGLSHQQIREWFGAPW